MNRPLIDEIQKNLNAATPGPWEWAAFASDPAGEQAVHVPSDSQTKRNEDGTLSNALTICRGMTGSNREVNAIFLAGSWEATKLMLAWIRHLEADRERVDKAGLEVMQKLDAEREENTRLRGALKLAQEFLYRGATHGDEVSVDKAARDKVRNQVDAALGSSDGQSGTGPSDEYLLGVKHALMEIQRYRVPSPSAVAEVLMILNADTGKVGEPLKPSESAGKASVIGCFGYRPEKCAGDPEPPYEHCDPTCPHIPSTGKAVEKLKCLRSCEGLGGEVVRDSVVCNSLRKLGDCPAGKGGS